MGVGEKQEGCYQAKFCFSVVVVVVSDVVVAIMAVVVVAAACPSYVVVAVMVGVVNVVEMSLLVEQL